MKYFFNILDYMDNEIKFEFTGNNQTLLNINARDPKFDVFF